MKTDALMKDCGDEGGGETGTFNGIRRSLMIRVYGEDKDFGAQLCTEIHLNNLTFDTLAAKWRVSLPLLGALIADHCYKLTAIVDDEVHSEEEYHSRFELLESDNERV